MPAATSRKLRNPLPVDRAQLRFVPVIATDRVHFCDIELAVVKSNAMRRVQSAEHWDRRFSMPSVLRIRQGQHYAIAHVGDEQHTARTESHLARMGYIGKDRDMEIRRHL